MLGTPEVWAGKGPSQTDFHVRNTTHKSSEPGCPPFFPSLLFPCLLSPYFPFFSGVLFPSSILSAWWQSPLHCPHLLSPAGRVPPPHPGASPPCTYGCCLQIRRDLGSFECRGTGRACSCVSFMLLAMARQILHLTTFLTEPVLPQHSSPRLLNLIPAHLPSRERGASMAPNATYWCPVLFFF